MINYKHDGKRLTLTAPTGGVEAGLIYVIGSLVVVSQDTVGEGNLFVGYTEGVFEIAKATGAVTEGVKLYWDSANKVLTTTATSNTLVGYAIAAAGSADPKTLVLLDH